MILITDNDECAALLDVMGRAGTLFLDTEFVRETTYFPLLCLLQIASDLDHRVFVVDTLEVDTAPLIDALLQSPARTVFHAGKQDLEIIHLMTERLPDPLWDTQIMAAFLGYGDQVGMERLAAAALRRPVDKTQQYTDWAQRPLTDRQLAYAAQDVVILKDLWNVLYPALEQRGRTPWAIEETLRLVGDPALYRIQPDQAWERLKIRKGEPRVLARLQKLAAWREEQAIRDNRPRGRIIADDALIGLAERPRQKDRWLKGMPDDWADELARLADERIHDSDAILSTLERKISLTPDQDVLCDALKLIVKIIARDEGIAAPLLTKTDDLMRFVLDAQDPALPFASGWRRAVVYDRLAGFCTGAGTIRCMQERIVLE